MTYGFGNDDIEPMPEIERQPSAVSSNGRTPDFDFGNSSSNPETATDLKKSCIWRQIKTAPEDINNDVLGFDGKTVVVMRYDCKGYQWWATTGFIIFEPTHWMPLPEPPKEKK